MSGETLLHLGRRYVLKRVHSDDGRHVKLLRGQTLRSARDRVKAALRTWYQHRAMDVFHRRLTHVEERLLWLKERPDWWLLEMKTQWGGCSPRGDVLLEKAPTECIDYIILHELCHLEEHNHSLRFYDDLLRYAMPRWEVVWMDVGGVAE